MVHTAGAKRIRLDKALVERGQVDSREKAQRIILAGQVRINQQRARKPSDLVRSSDLIEVMAAETYVSRGGYKLEGALREFQLDVRGLIGRGSGSFNRWIYGLFASAGRCPGLRRGRRERPTRLEIAP